jgi:hypothetical protein
MPIWLSLQLTWPRSLLSTGLLLPRPNFRPADHVMLRLLPVCAPARITSPSGSYHGHPYALYYFATWQPYFMYPPLICQYSSPKLCCPVSSVALNHCGGRPNTISIIISHPPSLFGVSAKHAVAGARQQMMMSEGIAAKQPVSTDEPPEEIPYTRVFTLEKKNRHLRKPRVP